MANYPRRKKFNKKTRILPKMNKPVVQKNGSTWRKLAGAVVKYAPMAITVAKMASQINSERKYFDTVQNATLLTNTGTMYCVSAMAEGTTQNLRVGISQLNDTLFQRGYIQLPATYDFTTGGGVMVREVLFVWNDNFQQNIINVANLTKLFEDPTIPQISTLEIEGSKSFSIIRDKIHRLSIANPVAELDDYRKINPLHSKYDGALATDLTFSHIFRLFVSNQGIAGNQPLLYSYERLRYYDN